MGALAQTYHFPSSDIMEMDDIIFNFWVDRLGDYLDEIEKAKKNG